MLKCFYNFDNIFFPMKPISTSTVILTNKTADTGLKISKLNIKGPCIHQTLFLWEFSQLYNLCQLFCICENVMGIFDTTTTEIFWTHGLSMMKLFTTSLTRPCQSLKRYSLKNSFLREATFHGHPGALISFYGDVLSMLWIHISQVHCLAWKQGSGKRC